jgi:hypothetical protein
VGWNGREAVGRRGGGAGRVVGGEEGDKKTPKNRLQVETLSSCCSSTQLYTCCVGVVVTMHRRRDPSCLVNQPWKALTAEPTLESTYC